jgi:putative exporter of polyketide antibiotics
MFRLDGDKTAAIPMSRLFGIRNAVLAAGLLRLDSVTSPRTFVGVNVLIDVVDALALIAAGRRGDIPVSGAVLAGGTALLATGLGVAALAALNDTPSALV